MSATVIELFKSDEAKVQEAVAAGRFPEDSVLHPALAVRLFERDSSEETVATTFDGKYTHGQEKMGRLNTRPRQIVLGRTTLEWYGNVVASMTIWSDAEAAQNFADYENGLVERYEPHLNTDKMTMKAQPVVWEQINAEASTTGSGRDTNWRVEVI